MPALKSFFARFNRRTAIVAVGFILAFALIVVMWKWGTDWRHWQHVQSFAVWSADAESQAPFKTGTGKTVSRRCEKSSPIFIAIKNGSSKTWKRISYGINGVLPGRSTDIVFDSDSHSQDWITRPGSVLFGCETPSLKPEYQDHGELPWALWSITIQSIEWAE